VAMEYTIEFSGSAAQDVTVVTSGVATPEDLSGYIQALVDDPRFRPGMRILADHQLMDASALSAGDVRAQAEMMKGLDARIGPSWIAMVVPSTLEFGFARMYQSHTTETQAQAEVFYTRHAALAWLEAQALADASSPRD
jgi:hypothetical protein